MRTAARKWWGSSSAHARLRRRAAHAPSLAHPTRLGKQSTAWSLRPQARYGQSACAAAHSSVMTPVANRSVYADERRIEAWAYRLAVFQLTAPAGDTVQLLLSAQNTMHRHSAAKAAKAHWPVLFLCSGMVKSLLKLSLSVPGACSGLSEGCCCRRRPAPELPTLAAAELLRSDRLSASQSSFPLAWIARSNRHRWRPGNDRAIPGGSPASATSQPGAVIPPARLPTKMSNHANF